MWQYNYSPSNGNRYLSHAGEKSYKGHKFIRKYRGPSGKWVYVYKDKADQWSTKARIEVTKGKKNKKRSEYITQHYTNDKGQREIVGRTKVTRITKASKSKKKDKKSFVNTVRGVGLKKGSAKTKKAMQKAFKSLNHDDKRQRAGLAKSSKLTKDKVKTKTSKKKKPIISSKTTIKSYTIGSKSGAKKKKK